MSAMGITKPAALKGGDTIAFISPSSRTNDIFPTRITRAEAFLESRGYTVKIIFNAELPKDHIARVKARCEEIHTAFRDPDVKAIVCTLGGITANELLPLLDYDHIKANPKIFCGFSDITLLHHAFYTQCGLRTFYGPSAIKQWGEYPSPPQLCIDHFFSIVTGGSGPLPRSKEWTQEFGHWELEPGVLREREFSPSPAWKWLRGGKAQGRLYGGCLPSLCQITGSKYLPPGMYEGRILFLETPESDHDVAAGMLPEMARCSMTDLRNAGIFDGIKGLVLGRPFMYDEEARKNFESMVLDQCYGTTFPILANLDVGHTDPIVTLPLDALCEMDSEKDEFRILEASVV